MKINYYIYLCNTKVVSKINEKEVIYNKFDSICRGFSKNYQYDIRLNWSVRSHNSSLNFFGIK